MKHLYFFTPVVLLLTACSTPQTKQVSLPLFSVAQVASYDNTFVFCEEGKCLARTEKVMLREAPAAGTTVHRPDFGSSASHFKVHFGWGSSAIDSHGQKELDTITQSQAFRNSRTILVAGRTDPSGSPQSNKRLAQRRADTVKRGLLAAGAKSETVTATIQEPCCTGKTPEDRYPDATLRRADVAITPTTPSTQNNENTRNQ